MKKFVKGIFLLVSIMSVTVLSCIGYWHYTLPDDYYVEKGDELRLNEQLTARSTENVKTANAAVGNSYTTSVKWLGVFPVKTVSVKVVNESVVVLGGMPFGVKLYTDGVMVVSLSTVDSRTGNISPARNAGLKVGDQILSINGQEVYTNEQVSEIVKESAGEMMVLRIKRDGIESQLRFCAVYSPSEQCYKAGMWVRDSSAGIGTVTFYDPQSHTLGGLGHPVCDVDTGEIVPISSGEIVPARVYNVKKSESGIPGELRGGFDFGSYGPLLSNGTTGVYARCEEGIEGELVEIMLKQDIREGNARIYTTISGTEPDWYDIRIEQVRHYDKNATRNMVIEITDKRLLEKTGGIVQGMSGSPIVQNGKLVGAVTHVLVNDPTRGYAIFAENMLETAQKTIEQYREAS